MQDLHSSLREALRPRGSRTLPFSDLVVRVFGPQATEADIDLLRTQLETLERRGEVVRVRGEKFSLIEYTNFQAGSLAIRGEGRAFLLSGERGVPDVPIQKGALSTALDGDFVLVRLEKVKASRRDQPRRPNPSPFSGEVVRVLTRRRDTVVGRILRKPEGVFLRPFDHRIDAEIRVPEGHDMEAPDGIYADARFLSFPDQRRVAHAEVIEIIGFEGEPGVDVEVVARKWVLPRAFTQECISEALAAPRTIPPDELAERADYRNRVIVTIDGETARDFDDAIEAEELEGGGFRLGIHIADVSFYVTPGTALDGEAYERGTSVYFPDRAIPMLPEQLSNDLCSLRPNEDRRTVSAILTIDSRGQTAKAQFSRSLIRSQARLTYTAVGKLLEKPDSGKPEEGQEAFPEAVIPMLRVAAKAAKVLSRRREERGALDFDLPDADLILGETGDVVAIVREVRNEAHRLIEEFMLAANEAVAKHLQFIPTPALYRVHDQPDVRKLTEIRAVLEPLGYDIPESEDGEVRPEVFQALIDQAMGRPEERFVSDLVLRAQMKALYSNECRGHYALAAPYYCHFTSPIRRYPDLAVHRALVEWIATKRAPEVEEAERRERRFVESALHCSERERRAESAEREAASWKKFVFLSRKVGEQFGAFISGVTPFGLFVTLSDLFAEGLVSVSSLHDDYYRYDDVEHRLVGTNSGKVFRLGDPLMVRLTQADHERRTLEFALASDQAVPHTKNRVEAIDRSKRRDPRSRRKRAR